MHHFVQNLRATPTAQFSRLSLLVVMLLWTATENRALAQPGPAFKILQWNAPLACGSLESFALTVRESLGSPEKGSAYHQTLSVSIHIEKERNVFQLLLTTENSDGKGERNLEAENCGALLASAALVLSLSLAPELLFNNESNREVLVTRTTTPHSVSPTHRQEDDSETPEIESLTETGIAIRNSTKSGALTNYRRFPVSLHLAVVTDFGTLPRPGFGIAIEASQTVRRFRIAVRLTRWGQQDEFLDISDRSLGGRFDFLETSLLLCHRYWQQVGICSSTSVGRLSANAIDIEEPIGQVHPMASVGGGAYWMSRSFGRWKLRLQGEILVQLIKPRYSVGVLDPTDNSLTETQLHVPSAMAARFSGSVGVSF